MNERIRELAFECARQLNWNPPSDPKEYTFSSAGLEKFAELIVRECASLAKTKSYSIVERAEKYAEDADEETSAKATAWQFLVFEQEIKQHFGVEE